MREQSKSLLPMAKWSLLMPRTGEAALILPILEKYINI